jgi:hypothetical protein
MIGQELGMVEADLQGETKEICAKVWGTIDNNMKVAFKGKAALKVTYKPAVCRVNVEASAKAAAECEGKLPRVGYARHAGWHRAVEGEVPRNGDHRRVLWR